MPHSLGLLYASGTAHLGFLHSSDEYKVTALAALGTPRYAGLLREHLRTDEQGPYELTPLDTARAFGRRSGVPVLINTSFNVRGQPIVCTPRHALEAFISTPLDALVIGRYLLVKPELRQLSLEAEAAGRARKP